LLESRVDLTSTVLAFSCEAARVISQCTEDAARLRLLQRPRLPCSRSVAG